MHVFLTTKRKINFFAEAAALANSQKSIRGNCPSRGCDVGGANVFQMGQKVQIGATDVSKKRIKNASLMA
ncbi:hypothetical protein AF269_15860 [Listeria monocytogenes]|nr:hypothetical protein AF269_15860 [Listeria monocytogenes]